MKVLGKFKHPIKTDAAGKSKTVEFIVMEYPLNLLGIAALRQLQVSVDSLIYVTSDGMAKTSQKMKASTTQKGEAKVLQKACQELSKEFSDLFTPELGDLENFEMKVKFKQDTKPTYCKTRMVPLALLDNLN